MVITDLVNLILGYFKQRSDLGDLRHPLESVQLVSSHSYVGAWCLLNFLVADVEEFMMKVANKRAWIIVRGPL